MVSVPSARELNRVGSREPLVMYYPIEVGHPPIPLPLFDLYIFGFRIRNVLVTETDYKSGLPVRRRILDISRRLR